MHTRFQVDLFNGEADMAAALKAPLLDAGPSGEVHELWVRADAAQDTLNCAIPQRSLWQQLRRPGPLVQGPLTGSNTLWVTAACASSRCTEPGHW